MHCSKCWYYLTYSMAVGHLARILFDHVHKSFLHLHFRSVFEIIRLVGCGEPEVIVIRHSRLWHREFDDKQ